MIPTFDTNTCLPSTPNLWTVEVEKQKENKLNETNTDPNEVNQHIPTLAELMTRQNYDNVTFSVVPSDERDLDEITDDIIDKFTWNRKQKAVFKRAIISNVKIKRNEETTQIIICTGGPGDSNNQSDCSIS